MKKLLLWERETSFNFIDVMKLQKVKRPYTEELPRTFTTGSKEKSNHKSNCTFYTKKKQ